MLNAQVGDPAGLSCALLGNSCANPRIHIFGVTRCKTSVPSNGCQKPTIVLNDMFIHSVLALGITSLVTPKTLAKQSPIQLILSRRLHNNELIRMRAITLPKKNVPLKNYYDGTDLQYVVHTLTMPPP